jgi:rSAM/selenodomain-associated transferase 1
LPFTRNGIPPDDDIHLVVMARWPAPGRCKRRLAVSIGSAAAARIQSRLTRHTLAVAVRATAAAGVGLTLAVDGLAPSAARRWGRSLGVERVRPQGAGSLGLRLQRQLLQSFRAGARAVALIGTDLPDLDGPALAAAFTALARQTQAQRPFVLGPARDGGYWLIGVGANCPSAPLMAGIPWGSDRVLEHTCRAAAAAGLTPDLLSPRSDLDRLDDLAPWLS